jgi:hypothetical protein
MKSDSCNVLIFIYARDKIDATIDTFPYNSVSDTLDLSQMHFSTHITVNRETRRSTSDITYDAIGEFKT